MSKNWYKFRVRYAKQLDSGKTKKVSEEYLVDAMSFTETEKRATKAASDLISTRVFDITAISREPISDIIHGTDSDESHWYKANVAFVSENEETGEKKQVEELQTVEVKYEADEGVFKIPSDYAEK